MKKNTMSKREFLRHPPAGSSLKHGETLVVTDRGTPAFQVSRVGRRGKSGEDYRREARKLWPRKGKPVNTANLLRVDER
jgi:antitoxin (DNA-binding transcriptional repressor) of toxin-antitoxin stability system